MKVSDYVAQRLAVLGLTRCFAVTGGGAMHLNDSFGEARGLASTYMHHEQACAIAAEGYARISGRPAVVCVTSGPGAINALNGVFGAFTDSVPMIIVSGQVKTETLLERVGSLPLRQLGDQEARSEAYIPAFVKSFQRLRTAEEAIAAIDRAVGLATHGRSGPCWIEIPVDVQGAHTESLRQGLHGPLRWSPDSDRIALPSDQDRIAFASLLQQAQRPLLLLGTGVRLSGAQQSVLAFAESLNLPIVTAWTHDICDNDHPLFVGRPGTIGTRPGNFAVQTCDLLIVLGSRLNIRQVSYNWNAFAKHAQIVMVDIDSAELCKPYLSIALPIQCDIKSFISLIQLHLAEHCREIFSDSSQSLRRQWLARLRQTLDSQSPNLRDYKKSPLDSGINPYHFIFALGRHLGANDRVVCGDATACIVPFQILPMRQNQRMFSNSGCASMGYDLPAGLGAAFATLDDQLRGTTIVLAGDGSLMMNLQELQTLASSKLDVVLFILDNNGYLSIKQTQSNFFGREHGASPKSGISFPDFVQLAEAFGLPVTQIDASDDLDIILPRVIQQAVGPRVCVVELDERQEFEPRLKSRIVDGEIRTPELDDMFPHLSSDELSSIRTYLLSAS